MKIVSFCCSNWLHLLKDDESSHAFTGTLQCEAKQTDASKRRTGHLDVFTIPALVSVLKLSAP